MKLLMCSCLFHWCSLKKEGNNYVANNKKRNKASIITIISIIVALVITQSLPFTIFASEGQYEDGKVIPDYMQPGSVIKYIDNERYEIIKGGDPAGDKYRNREEVEKEVSLLMVEEYPEPEQGMMVYYADDGQVNKIIFGSKEAEERWLTLSPEEQKKIDEISKSERQNANYSDNEISDLTIEELIDRSSLVLIAQWGSNPNKLYRSGNTGIRIGKGRATVFGDRVG